MSRAIADAFDAKLRKSSATHDDVLRLYPPATASPEIAPLEQVRFYEDFTDSPEQANERSDEARAAAAELHGMDYLLRVLRSDKHHELKKYRSFDFRLTDEETRRLKEYGFVVSPRLASDSFGSMYYRLYTNDMPVFVSSDSVLHAWHHSFDAFLLHFESQALLPLLDHILQSTLAACAKEVNAACASGGDDFVDVYGEVELFLAVAHQLLQDGGGFHQSFPSLRVTANANRLSDILELVSNEELTKTEIFGAPRLVDFSLFKPRGHYTKSADLQRYFRAMTWLGTVDFRIAGAPEDDEEAQASERRQLQCACVLVHLLRKAGVMPLISTLHQTISAIAGDGVGADSMTPMQLHDLLTEGDASDILERFCGPDSAINVTQLQDEIANRGLGAQAIIGHPMKANPFSTKPIRPPTAFALLGQQFVWSAFVFSKLVYDQVIDAKTGAKVPRRMTSAVDAAFAVFGNNVAGAEIVKRMTGANEDSVAFRDGFPYASNLLAAREVVDEAMDKAAADPGSCTLPQLWQLALRELSHPSAHNGSVFQSETWQKRQMNTQIASFAQLRHDTLLYAKQACTGFAECEYPQLAERTLAIVGNIKNTLPRKTRSTRDDGDSWYEQDYIYVFDRAETCFEWFRDVTRSLAGIAAAQASNQQLSDEQALFLKNIIEKNEGSGDPYYTGWYPALFYSNGEDSCSREHLVADIHTDAPSELHGDPGGVLHLGVGDVNLGFFIIDNVMYAGPMFSHYEFVTPINERLTDDEFSARLSEFEAPSWATQSFLAPRGEHQFPRDAGRSGTRNQHISNLFASIRNEGLGMDMFGESDY